MNKDYFFNMRMQPAYDCIMDALQVTDRSIITQLYQQWFGNGFNVSELATNVNPNVYFVGSYILLYNNEGTNRYIVLFVTGGRIIYITGAIGAATSGILSITIPFNFMRINNAGGFPANAATVITFCGFRIQI